MKKIVFYGASVTRQNATQAGELVGYVPNVQRILAGALPDEDLQFAVLGFGSNHFDDAGFVYFQELLDAKPDIAILDWHSTGLSEFNPEYYAYVLRTLYARGVKVINVIFPHRAYVGKPEREHIKQARYYQCLGFPLVDLYREVGKRIDLDTCLRDIVHTTGEGGRVYGEIVAESLITLLTGHDIPYDTGDTIPGPERYDVPEIYKYKFSGEVPQGHYLHLDLYQKTPHPLTLLARMKVGPYSPIIRVSCGWAPSQSFTIWDQWCTYERECLKYLSRSHQSPPSTCEAKLAITIENKDPDYTLAGKDPVVFQAVSKKLVVAEWLYALGTEIISAEVRPSVS